MIGVVSLHLSRSFVDPAIPAMFPQRRDRSSDLASLIKVFWWNAWESPFDCVVWENYIRRLSMTSLASWSGIDSRGATSIYLVSDSRISSADTASNFDHGSVGTGDGRNNTSS
jgi:hypothetical protein